MDSNVNTNNNVESQKVNTEPTGQQLQNMISNSNEISNASENQYNNLEPQKDLQSIATVDQSNEKFINNTQSSSQEKKESTDGKMNYTFIFILFVVIFAAIFFLFPLLSKYI